jgi:hypothetical protein
MDSSNAIVLPEDKLQTNRKHAKNLVWYGMWSEWNVTLFFIFQNENLNIQSVLFY